VRTSSRSMIRVPDRSPASPCSGLSGSSAPDAFSLRRAGPASGGSIGLDSATDRMRWRRQVRQSSEVGEFDRASSMQS